MSNYNQLHLVGKEHKMTPSLLQFVAIIYYDITTEYNYKVKTEAQSSMNYTTTIDGERCDK